jgi:hypothetical protein
MATGTAYGTNYALKNTPRIGTWPNAAQCNSELYCLSDECYADSAGQATSLMYVGILPVGAIVQFSVVWPIDSDEVADGAAAMTNAVTGEMGTLTDPDLFGDITALNVAATQVIAPCPDGTTYTTTLDFALRAETTVVIKTGAATLADTEGIAVKIFYTMAGRTYT